MVNVTFELGSFARSANSSSVQLLAEVVVPLVPPDTRRRFAVGILGRATDGGG
jgi:hypothetical protein